MKWPILGVIVVGFIAALAATVLIISLRAGGKPESDEGDTVEILVAVRDLPAIQLIATGDVAARRVKKEDVPAEALTNSLQLIGQVLISPVLEGQVFTSKHLATTQSGVHLAATLPPGFRAMGVTLSTDTGIEDVLYPGSMVDVVASFKLPALDGGSSPEVVSATILQGVQVLGVGQRTIVSETVKMPENAVNDKRDRMVLLMVDSKQAEMLNLASNHGKLSVSLRNPLDQNAEDLQGTRMSDLSSQLAQRIAALTAIQDARGSLQVASEELPGDPNDAPPAVPSAGEPAEPVQLAAAAPVPVWTTVVMRGRVVEKQTFDSPVVAGR